MENTIPSTLSHQDIKEIVDYLRGDFLFRPTLENRLNDIDRNLMRYTEEQLQIRKDSRNYFEEVLPERFYDYVNSLSSQKLEELQYDVLVMDEAQDILKANYLFKSRLFVTGWFGKGKMGSFLR